jgi:hypothetical protein
MARNRYKAGMFFGAGCSKGLFISTSFSDLLCFYSAGSRAGIIEFPVAVSASAAGLCNSNTHGELFTFMHHHYGSKAYCTIENMLPVNVPFMACMNDCAFHGGSLLIADHEWCPAGIMNSLMQIATRVFRKVHEAGDGPHRASMHPCRSIPT